MGRGQRVVLQIFCHRSGTEKRKPRTWDNSSPPWQPCLISYSGPPRMRGFLGLPVMNLGNTSLKAPYPWSLPTWPAPGRASRPQSCAKGPARQHSPTHAGVLPKPSLAWIYRRRFEVALVNPFPDLRCGRRASQLCVRSPAEGLRKENVSPRPQRTYWRF